MRHLSKVPTIIILLLLYIPVFGQNIYNATVTDGLVVVPFVNVGVLNTSVRTVSNEYGEFSLQIDDGFMMDSLVISCVGFESRKLLVSEFIEGLTTDSTIVLISDTIELTEIIVASSKLEKRILGNSKAGEFIQAGFSSVEPGDEMGTIIKIKKTPTFVRSFHADITFIRNDSMKLRLNFYDLKKGRPNKRLPVESIIFSTENIEKGRFDLDLSNYNIVMTDDFYISIECLENNDSERKLVFAGSLMNGPVIARVHDDTDWRKYGTFGIGFFVVVEY